MTAKQAPGAFAPDGSNYVTIVDGAGSLGSGSSNISTKSAQVVTATATIANSASLSGAVDCSGGRLAHIEMPATWTAANLTFTCSSDGVAAYNDLYDSFGTEYVVVAAASRSITIPLSDFLGARYLKVRSGTSGTPVTQGGSRDIILVLAP